MKKLSIISLLIASCFPASPALASNFEYRINFSNYSKNSQAGGGSSVSDPVADSPKTGESSLALDDASKQLADGAGNTLAADNCNISEIKVDGNVLSFDDYDKNQTNVLDIPAEYPYYGGSYSKMIEPINSLKTSKSGINYQMLNGAVNIYAQSRTFGTGSYGKLRLLADMGLDSSGYWSLPIEDVFANSTSVSDIESINPIKYAGYSHYDNEGNRILSLVDNKHYTGFDFSKFKKVESEFGLGVDGKWYAVRKIIDEFGNEGNSVELYDDDNYIDIANNLALRRDGSLIYKLVTNNGGEMLESKKIVAKNVSFLLKSKEVPFSVLFVISGEVYIAKDDNVRKLPKPTEPAKFVGIMGSYVVYSSKNRFYLGGLSEYAYGTSNLDQYIETQSQAQSIDDLKSNLSTSTIKSIDLCVIKNLF